MARFNFRLATLLKIREAARDERRLQLAQAYQADAVLQGQQQELAESLAQLEREHREASSPGEIHVDRLLQTQRHEMLIRAQIGHVAKQREAVAEEIERRRAVLAEANRQVKVLENLRQRQFQRHQEEENRGQVKLMDEVAARRASQETYP